LSLMRASSVVNRQLTPRPARLRAACHITSIDLALAEGPAIRGVSLCATQAPGPNKAQRGPLIQNLIRNGFLLSCFQRPDPLFGASAAI
jgi:hypothetical protein